jgi:peptide/nickel transport system substrate-binding protein
MTELEFWAQQVASRRIGRREFIGRAATLGVTAALASTMLSKSGVADEPNRGGTLRQGLAGGSTSDSLDPATWADNVNNVVGYSLFNTLVEIDDQLAATPELAESWEARPGAAEWIFNIRKDVHFHNGKALDADDVIYSIQRHMGPNSKSGAKGQLAGITQITKLDTHQIKVGLASGNADLPYNLSDYHLQIVPNNFNDWSRPVGTGAFILESYDPGVHCMVKRNPSYWKPGRGHFDAVETVVINDATARSNALLTNQLDVINRVDRKTVELLAKVPDIKIMRSSGDQHYLALMDSSSAEFKDNNVRLAMKYAIDREQALQVILRGYGQLGNDHPVAATNRFFNTELPQRQYDADKARYYLRQAGLSSLRVDLHASSAAFAEAVDTAVLFQSTAAKAGIAINVMQEPADGYWDRIWRKVPFCMSNWGGRPTADGMFSIAYKCDASWNDTHWCDPDFDKLVLEARAELDVEKRKAMYWEMQKIANQDGGSVIPLFGDFLDALHNRVKGFTPSAAFAFSGYRLDERGWFES